MISAFYVPESLALSFQTCSGMIFLSSLLPSLIFSFALRRYGIPVPVDALLISLILIIHKQFLQNIQFYLISFAGFLASLANHPKPNILFGIRLRKPNPRRTAAKFGRVVPRSAAGNMIRIILCLVSASISRRC